MHYYKIHGNRGSYTVYHEQKFTGVELLDIFYVSEVACKKEQPYADTFDIIGYMCRHGGFKSPVKNIEYESEIDVSEEELEWGR